jgi:hypothetical protein
MKCNRVFSFLVPLLFLPVYSNAQLWSGILKPTYGSGACNYAQVSAAGQCAIDWTAVGIPGGIPSASWTQSGSTIAAGGGDMTSTIQAALNSCGTNHYVLLGSGTFNLTGVQVKSNCVLRGSGPQSTILNATGTSGAVVSMGIVGDAPYKNGSATITSGATAGSTSMVVAAKSQDGNQTTVGVGGFILITELNDPVYVSAAGIQNTSCTYCDQIFGGTRARGQIVQITSVTGSGPYTVGFTPALYTNYGVATGTSPAWATPFGVENGGQPDCSYCGLESLQIKTNGTGLSEGMADISMYECVFCWVKNVEDNYTDGDHLDDLFGFRDEIRDSYFSNGFGHGAGGTDADVMLAAKTSGTLVENNIMERLHGSIINNWGAAGNVYGYNYLMGSYDAVGTYANQLDLAANHGFHPQFNLFEGNVGASFEPDDFHGSSSNGTTFRNWWRADTLVAPYQAQAINSISCSGGTCTITWATPPSHFYAGQYIIISGTSNASCGGSNGPPNPNWMNPNALLGSAGTLSSQFSSGSCTGATGGQAVTLDLAPVPPPIPHATIDWANAYHTFQQNWGEVIGWDNTNFNIIGDVVGSDAMAATIAEGDRYNSGANPCTSCVIPLTATSYGGYFYPFRYGYDCNGDSNGSGVTTLQGGPSNTAGYWVGMAYGTSFIHGVYDTAKAAVQWDIHGTGNETLPPSFYRSSKPSWFGNVPWPAIGPDVSGGPDTATAGHANYIPAEVCYNNLSRDSTGIKEFDANTCYGTTQAPDPPTGLAAVVH